MNLVGKIVRFYRDGNRGGRVVRVNAGKRVGLRSLRVCVGVEYDKGRFRFSGRTVTVTPSELSGPCCGVLVRGKLQPIGGGA